MPIVGPLLPARLGQREVRCEQRVGLGWWRAAIHALSAALWLGSVAAPARCWAPADVSAARVREMQTRLAVVVLQCRAKVDMLAGYNQFLSRNRAALRSANQRLKAHFMAEGKMAGQREYDRYTTALANAYGGGETSPASCARTSALMTEATLPRGNLASLAAREVVLPTIPSAPCLAGQGPALAAR